ncbi:MAG: PEP-CTERM sorting domain-containing protein [Gammaproteobacteria bacterium]|nr:PEP-CTERM sorting domain-containing protein [Gammaproteobacteria bacterium]MCF6231155.1 PEP-CTERM sorting domain-containing protein [Gammaproteobacteria bacterium]
MNIKQLLPVALIGLLGTVGTASAAPMTFNFDTNVPGIYNATGFTQTQMGTTVAVTGTGDLYNTRQGIGVGSDALTSSNESISFTFTPNAVSLLSGLVFESASAMTSADFALYGDGVLLDNYTFTNQWAAGNGQSYFNSITFDNWSATTFNFAGMSDNGFRIKYLTVDVPEPGMVAMLGLGLLMAGVATRRRRKS